jgi:hypothetical protein
LMIKNTITCLCNIHLICIGSTWQPMENFPKCIMCGMMAMLANSKVQDLGSMLQGILGSQFARTPF